MCHDWRWGCWDSTKKGGKVGSIISQLRINLVNSDIKQQQAKLPLPMRITSSRASPPTHRHHSSPQPPPSERNRQAAYPRNIRSQNELLPPQHQPCIKLNTSHLEDRPKGNKIIIRKSKNSFPIGLKTSYSHFRNDSNPLPLGINVHQSVQFSHRRTQKQRFIDELQSKVLNSSNQTEVRCKTTEEPRIRKVQSHRYNATGKDLTARSKMNMNRSCEGVISDKNSKESNLNGLLKIRSLHQDDDVESPYRSRSRTIAKEYIIQDIQEMLSPAKTNDLSKTIQINPLEIKEKIRHSLNEIEKFEKRSISPETQEIGLQSYRGRNSGINVIQKRPTQMDDASDINNSIFIKNTQIYEQEIDHLTNEFFGEWAKMSLNKSQLYQGLRNKLIKQYPNMRKHYSNYNIPKEDDQTPQKPSKSDHEQLLFSNELHSHLKLSQNLHSSNQSLNNVLSVTQIKEYQQKLQFFNQKRMLRDIFKQAYFYSRTRNKFMSTNYVSTEEKEEEIELKNIQKNLTFMGYMRDKSGKSVLNRKRKIRGTNIIKNKDSILELEPEGTKGQEFLKKCLDDAIEDCIRANK